MSTALETPLLEQIRAKHEEIQRLEVLVMKELMKEELSPMEKLSQWRRLRSMTKSIILKTEKLVKTYEEKEDAIAIPLGDETEIWTAFSNRLHEIHEYHGKHPSEPLVDYDYEQLLVDDSADYEAPLEAKVEKLCNLLDETMKRIFEDMDEEKPMEQAMGWDGKPIPYLLNQLGLCQECKCEICNTSYWGKTALETHFQEWRHLWSLGCLGILDSEEKFIKITSFEEVEQVRKIQRERRKDEKEIFKEKKSGMLEIRIPLPTTFSKYSGDDAEDEFIDPPLPHKFIYTLAEGITAKEFDMIKLAAEFWARYGRHFGVGFKRKMANDPYFEFIKKPTGDRCSLFAEFVSAYVEVLVIPPLEVLKEKLRQNAADMETILENCYNRLQWDRFPWGRGRIVKKARKE